MYFGGGSVVFAPAFDRFLMSSCNRFCSAIVHSLCRTFPLLLRQAINWKVDNSISLWCPELLSYVPMHLMFPNELLTIVLGIGALFPMCFINVECVVSFVVVFIVQHWNVDGQCMCCITYIFTTIMCQSI